MIEQTVSLNKVATFGAWSVSFACLVTAVIVGPTTGRWWLALLFAEGACVSSAVAATLTARCYMSRLAALVVATAPTETERPQRIHSLR